MSETAEVIVFDQNAGLGVGIGDVDTSAGTIKGVSIATAGVKAEGHEMVIVDADDNVLETREWFTDEETLETMLAAIQEIGQPLKAKIGHTSANGSGLREIVGTFDNFRIDGNHLRADFEAVDSTTEDAKHLMKLASKVSKQFGVSIEAATRRVKAGAVDLMRVIKAEAASFVDSPAINAGLFSQKNVVDKQLQSTQKRIQNPNTLIMNDELKTEMMELVGGVVDEKLSAMREEMQGVTDRLSKLETPSEEMSEGQKEEMAAAIKASITELEGKLSDTTELEAKIKAEYEAKVSELSAKVATAEQLSTALGIKRGASSGNGDTPETKSFATELAAKVKDGTPYGKALHELNREQPNVVKAELARRGLDNINLL